MNFKLILATIIFSSQVHAAKVIDADLWKTPDHTKTYTPPAATDTLMGRNSTDTVTNKSISGSTNTLSNIPLGSGVTGTLGIANGGTGQSTKAPAFDALSPMTTSGDIIYGGTSGTGTRLAKSTDGFVLTLASGLPAWAASGAGSTPTSSDEVYNLGLATSVASNALTINLKQADGSTAPNTGTSAVKISFRSSTAATGAYNERSVTAALSLVVTSGATLGTVNGILAYRYIYAIDNAGTVELAISGTKFDDGTILSTTVMNASSDFGNVIYSTTARTSVPVRLIGRIKVTEATAGTWATNAAEVSLLPFDSPLSVGINIGGTPQTSYTANTNVKWPTLIRETGSSGAYNTSTGEYTAPFTGWYMANAYANTDCANGSQIYIAINGTQQTPASGTVPSSSIWSSSGIAYAVAGDLISIQLSASWSAIGAGSYNGLAITFIR